MAEVGILGGAGNCVIIGRGREEMGNGAWVSGFLPVRV